MSRLVQIVDAALAEAMRRAGPHVVCRTGCTDCCMGTFAIDDDDAARLRDGLRALEAADPARALRIQERVRYANADDDDTPCPVLDPETGACDLYAARPLTCRTFGPAIRWRGGDLGICELNFRGASEDEILACAVEIECDDPGEGETTVVAALRQPR